MTLFYTASNGVLDEHWEQGRIEYGMFLAVNLYIVIFYSFL